MIDPTDAVLELMLRPLNVPIETFEPGVLKVPAELKVQINQEGRGGRTSRRAAHGPGCLFENDRSVKSRGVCPSWREPTSACRVIPLHRELELYVKAGMTPLEAIQAATITPARVMKLDNEVGTIEAGRRADLIVLDASPVENISNIRKVRLVVTQGRLFDCAKLWEIVGFQP